MIFLQPIIPPLQLSSVQFIEKKQALSLRSEVCLLSSIILTPAQWTNNRKPVGNILHVHPGLHLNRLSSDM